MDRPELEQLLIEQHGVAGVWQLRAIGLSNRQIHGWVRKTRQIHRGVWITGHAPLSPEQRRWAATLTTQSTVLSHTGAAWSAGYFDAPEMLTVTRPGSEGRATYDGLLVCHSTLLEGETIREPGKPPMTAPGRTLVDVLGLLRTEDKQRRSVRDALRVGAIDAVEIEAACRRYRGRRGVGRLRAFAADYTNLPATRSRSDAEILALATIDGAEIERPLLNVRIAGYEADLVWAQHRVLIELDGPSFHQFEYEDALRDEAWTSAGWTVHRVPTDVVYDDVNAFLRRVRAALHGRKGS